MRFRISRKLLQALNPFALTVDLMLSAAVQCLELITKKIQSNSVGYKSEFSMQSLDFEEFLWAKGYGDETVEDLLSHMKSGEAFNQTTMKTFNELFLDYCILGGMPKVVSSYIEKGTFEGSLALQQELISDYKEDIKKYVEGIDKTRVLNVFNHIPVQLAKKKQKIPDFEGCKRSKVQGLLGLHRMAE